MIDKSQATTVLQDTPPVVPIVLGSLLTAFLIADVFAYFHRIRVSNERRGLLYACHFAPQMQAERNRLDHWDQMDIDSAWEFPQSDGSYWSLSYPRAVLKIVVQTPGEIREIKIEGVLSDA
jgi:hypothetical protein